MSVKPPLYTVLAAIHALKVEAVALAIKDHIAARNNYDIVGGNPLIITVPGGEPQMAEIDCMELARAVVGVIRTLDQK